VIDSRIIDAHGSGIGLRINPEGQVNAVIHPHPPRGEQASLFPVRQRFVDSAGSFDMAVDGSTNNVKYSVTGSDQDRDTYIKYISLSIGDNGSPALNKFGALTALANGVRFIWESQSEGEIELHDGIKTNLEFIRIGSDTAAVGTGTDAFLSDTSGGGTEKNYLPSIDLSEIFGITYGIRLRKGTTDSLAFIVRDDLSSLITFDAIAYGLKI
jgi:hypothetical protein